MEKKISNAFTYMFKEKFWYKKVGIIAILYLIIFAVYIPFISTFISFQKHKDLAPQKTLMAYNLLMPIIVILMFFLAGYLLKCIQNVINNDGISDIILPNWADNTFNYFIIAAKKAGGVMSISYLLLPTIFLLGIPYLIFMFIGLALTRIFCTNFEFESYFKWKEAFKLIKNNIGLYLIILLFYIVINLAIIAFICGLFYFKIQTDLIAVLATITFTYFSLVRAYLIGIIGENKKVCRLEANL